MESYYYNSSTVLKYLRKVLNEINKEYVDNGIRAGFIMKRFASKYNFDKDAAVKLVLLCILKDIGVFYQDGLIPKDDYVLAAASSYTFLKHCSPLGEACKPLLFYRAKYMPELENDDYYCGLLITLIDKIVKYVFQEYTLNEIEEFLIEDNSGRYNPDQIKKVIKLLRDEPDILEKLNQKNSIFVHETCAFVQNANYSDEELLSYIDTTNFAFEFHNHETLAHTVTTAAIAKELSKLSRLTESQINCIELAALVHDIGKIRVPVEILCYPGRLEGKYLEEMRRHVIYTKEILEGSFSYKIVEIASNHHEKLDGSGYPKRLTAIDLSIGDKIIAIADITSALYCKRSYKESFSEDKIVTILENEARNNKLDQRIVNHLINNMDSIMAVAREKETLVLNKYNSMKEEYDVLSTSEQLKKFFHEEPIVEEEPIVSEKTKDVYNYEEDLNEFASITDEESYEALHNESFEVEATEPEVDEADNEAISDEDDFVLDSDNIMYEEDEYFESETEEFDSYTEENEIKDVDAFNEFVEETMSLEEADMYDELSEQIPEIIEDEPEETVNGFDLLTELAKQINDADPIIEDEYSDISYEEEADSYDDEDEFERAMAEIEEKVELEPEEEFYEDEPEEADSYDDEDEFERAMAEIEEKVELESEEEFYEDELEEADSYDEDDEFERAMAEIEEINDDSSEEDNDSFDDEFEQAISQIEERTDEESEDNTESEDDEFLAAISQIEERNIESVENEDLEDEYDDDDFDDEDLVDSDDELDYDDDEYDEDDDEPFDAYEFLSEVAKHNEEKANLPEGFDEEEFEKAVAEIEEIEYPDENEDLDAAIAEIEEQANIIVEEPESEIEETVQSFAELEEEDSEGEIIYVDEDGNPVDPPEEDVIYVDEYGNPVDDYDPSLEEGQEEVVEYVDEYGNPIDPEAESEVIYVDEYGNPVDADDENVIYVDEYGNPIDDYE